MHIKTNNKSMHFQKLLNLFKKHIHCFYQIFNAFRIFRIVFLTDTIFGIIFKYNASYLINCSSHRCNLHQYFTALCISFYHFFNTFHLSLNFPKPCAYIIHNHHSPPIHNVIPIPPIII